MQIQSVPHPDEEKALAPFKALLAEVDAGYTARAEAIKNPPNATAVMMGESSERRLRRLQEEYRAVRQPILDRMVETASYFMPTVIVILDKGEPSPLMPHP